MEKQITDHRHDFQTILKQKFFERLQKNAQYSLRSYARSLNIDPSSLSKLLSGKRAISQKQMVKLIQYLELSPEEIAHFQAPQEQEIDFYQLSLDKFNYCSSWHYDAILELTHLDHFQGDLKWIAKTLDLNLNEVKLAVETLQRLDLLKIENERWIDCCQNNLVAFADDYTNAALKNYQRGVLNKSLDSIGTIPTGQRQHRSFIVVMDEDLIPIVHQKIQNFLLKTVNFIKQNNKKKNKIYALQISSVPLSREHKPGEQND